MVNNITTFRAERSDGIQISVQAVQGDELFALAIFLRSMGYSEKVATAALTSRNLAEDNE